MIPELDPEKFHVLSSKQKLLVVLGILLFLLVIAPVLGYFYYNAAINRPSQLTKDMTFEIKKGDGLGEVGDSLYANGLINSKFLFFIYSRMSGEDKTIQAGVYKVPQGTSLVSLVELFQHGTNDVRITFLEGWRVEEFAREASKRFDKVDYHSFIKLAQPFEGYLFPDTYNFNVDATEQDILDTLVSTYTKKTEDILTSQALTKAGLDKAQTVIFASIVEREIHDEKERPVVAGILINRWKNGELLGADATTQYAVASQKLGCKDISTDICPDDSQEVSAEWWAKDLTVQDLDSASPFNTRKVSGLPPAPISNPGLSSLKAVVNYETTPYTFYLTDKDGVVHYAKTLDEHNANISRYLGL